MIVAISGYLSPYFFTIPVYCTAGYFCKCENKVLLKKRGTLIVKHLIFMDNTVTVGKFIFLDLKRYKNTVM